MQLIYVDESGDYGFSPENQYQLSLTPSRCFLRTCIFIHDRKWIEVNRKINDLRDKYNIPRNIELHATEIVKGRSRSGCNWFGLTMKNKEIRLQFLKKIYQEIIDIKDLSLACIIIDKTKIGNNTIADKKRTLICKSWELLIERVNLFIKISNEKKWYDNI